MTTDPWQHMLLAIEPAYKQYKAIVERGPKYIIDFSLVGDNQWQIRIREENDLGNIDERCEWAAEQLSTWPNCRRVAWDRWRFKHRRDAEKFKTLFTLKWAQ
jgi:hypothetical protein